MAHLVLKQWFQKRNLGLTRRFFVLFFATVLSSFLFSFSLPSVSSSASFSEIRGVWLTTNDTSIFLDQPKLKNAIATLADLNFNTIYPVVWNSGYALYPSQVAQDAQLQTFEQKGFQGQDSLEDLITQAHDQDLLVLPWFEFGFMAPPSSELALNHPDWLTQKRDGSRTTISAAGEVVWLNPFHPQVQQFLTSLVMEVMTQYDVDGIQFDDHLSLPSELGYDPYTLNLYRQDTHKEAPADPKDPAWLKWRADHLTAYVQQLHQAVKAKKQDGIFSLAPNPYQTAYRNSLQDWLTWLRQDLIDELIVQVYRPELDQFIQEIEKPEIQEAKARIDTGVGILSGLRNRPTPIHLIEEKALEAQRRGLGVSFFYYSSLWNYSPEVSRQRQKTLSALFPDFSQRQLPLARKPSAIFSNTASSADVDSTMPYEYPEDAIPISVPTLFP